MKKKTKNKIAFIGSFDPLHEGHIYIIQQMLNLAYDEYFLIVANNWDKVQPSLALRKAKAIKVLEATNINLKQLKVVSTSKRMTSYLKQKEINTIIRGYRDQQDQAYETYLYEIYKKDCPTLKRILIKTPKEFKHIRSSTIKEAEQ